MISRFSPTANLDIIQQNQPQPAWIAEKCVTWPCSLKLLFVEKKSWWARSIGASQPIPKSPLRNMFVKHTR